MHARPTARFAARASHHVPRGNTIVLVIGILVLLVIIATAFVVRTQAGRTTASATTNVGLRDDNARMIAGDLANEISAAALFVRPIDVSALGQPLDFRIGSNAPRLPIAPNAMRHLGDDQDNDNNFRPDYPFNTPPHAVVPFTNWPDPATTQDNFGSLGGNGNPADWPAGAGNPNVTIPPNSPLVAESNPLGNPGFGDTRWLRDLEPLRWDTNNDGILDAFSHWRHLSNIARPDNGWRICRDIADIEGVFLPSGGLVIDLNVPVEQWLGIPHAYLNPVTGNTYLPNANDFFAQWNNWFSMNGYINSYRNSGIGPDVIPPNFYKLNDLDGDGTPYNLFVGGQPQDRPQDEFVFGTARNIVSRVLADTDGDGFTDAFWFLAPTPVQAGTRTIVAVSVIDNQGMLNANTATRYIRADTTGVPRKTAGHTPTDVALVGQGVAVQNGNFNVGWYDNWESWLTLGEIDTRYDTNLTAAGNLWFRHLTEVGLTNAANVPLDFPDVATRLDYWRRSASRPLSADPFSRYTPFTLEDELELRMFAGQNYPWIASRYEFSLSNNINGSGISPMRANLNREESSEFIDQLINRHLAVDLRHRTTLYNGVRNDLAPPWLWLFGPYRDVNYDGVLDNFDRDLDGDGTIGDIDDIQLFQVGTRKFDLRLPYDSALSAVSIPGQWGPGTGFSFTPNTSALQFGIAVRDRLMVALMDSFYNLPGNAGTYYGASPQGRDRTLELAAAYAANIAQWRDRENQPVNDLTSRERSPLVEAVPVQRSPTNPNPTARFLGMEPQPFLVEAFFAHIYADQFGPIPATDAAGNPYTNSGQIIVNEDDATRSTLIVVQIANPYRRPINLNDPDVQYQVRVFGQEFDLNGLGVLPPASEDQPATLILYAIKDNITGTSDPDNLRARWVDFLDINAAIDLPPNSQVVRVDTSRWDVDSRNTYDSNSTADAVEIRRRDSQDTEWVTIDRFDPPNSRRFGDAINDMASNIPPPPEALPPSLHIHGDPVGQPYPGLAIGVDGSEYNHWVQWVRATRAWGVDVNNDGQINFNECNPRFVFGDYAVSRPFGDPANISDPNDLNTFLNAGDRYKFDAVAPDAPWFTRQYARESLANPGTDDLIKRKPTFFNFNHEPGNDPAHPNWSFPDKGWYGQKGVNSVDDSVLDTSTTPPTRNYRHPFAMQMLHKDDDFEQVGELLNVFIYGHKVRFTDNTATGTFTGETITTFSEYMSEDQGHLTGYQDLNARYRVNRLLMTPTTAGGPAGQLVGVGDPLVLDDPRHGVPNLPAGVRVLDAFVCDSYGVAPLIDLNGNGSVADEAFNRTLYNAKNFDGSGTPGMININTAPVEVMRAMPLMMRMVHETGGISAGQPYYNAAGQPLVTTALNPAAMLPRVMVPEAIKQYRERFNGEDPSNPGANPTGVPFGPNYQVRPNPRGINSIGELMLLNRTAQFPSGFVDRAASNAPDRVYNEHWRMDFDVSNIPLQVGAGLGPKPFFDLPGAGANQISMRVSTDRQDAWDPFVAGGGFRPDYVAGDVEEANALFAGISNLVTTRSDVFTVYFKVRTFRQNTSVNPPRWDATNPEYIIDDSRYVMLVDRSGVNKPGDQPKILYLEKLPN